MVIVGVACIMVGEHRRKHAESAVMKIGTSGIDSSNSSSSSSSGGDYNGHTKSAGGINAMKPIALSQYDDADEDEDDFSRSCHVIEMGTMPSSASNAAFNSTSDLHSGALRQRQ